jgi:hypothetical protein
MGDSRHYSSSTACDKHIKLGFFLNLMPFSLPDNTSYIPEGSNLKQNTYWKTFHESRLHSLQNVFKQLKMKSLSTLRRNAEGVWQYI